jgi:uncharacterized repeat protein (TIGR01451 family)
MIFLVRFRLVNRLKPVARANGAVDKNTRLLLKLCNAISGSFGRLVLILLTMLVGTQATLAQTTTFNFTGSLQTYLVPIGAVAIQVQVDGAGGGGGGADANGIGGNGGAGASVIGTYPVTSGSLLNIYVGGGGAPGFTSSFGRSCTNSAGAGGSAGGVGGVGGFAGGAGGAAGCSGYSGGGGGAGAASVLALSNNTPIVIAGGGSGGQGGSWNSTPAGPQNSSALGALPGAAGQAGSSPGANDGGGGGGGGGGCPGGAGGALHPDNSGTTLAAAAGAGLSCANAAVTPFSIQATTGGIGGIGAPAADGAYTNPGGTAGAPGKTIITPLYRINGSIYSDTNHNAVLNVGETGAPIAGLFVKMAALTGGVCQIPALASAPVNATTGAYTLNNLAAGDYCLTLTNSAALANTTAYLPPGWVGTEAASGVRQLRLGQALQAAQNFGLYAGSQITLQVFADTSVTAANDGVQNGGELGISNITVNATDSGNTVASEITDANGVAILWLPAGTGFTVITPAAPAGYAATGGSAGNTAGTYARPSVSFTPVTGSSRNGVAFGLVPPNILETNGTQTLQPGATYFYPHSYTAGSSGLLTFSVSSLAAPSLVGWNEVLYLDPNCSGVSSGAMTPLGGPITVVAGQKICVLVKEFVPAAAPLNAQNVITLNANLVYSGSSAPLPNLQKRIDITIVGSQGGQLQLLKQVRNVTLVMPFSTNNTAQPGHTLQYQVSLSNLGISPLSNLVVDDSIPAFTNFVSAACPLTLPVGLTGCSITVMPSVGGRGSVQWSFTGTLNPGSATNVSFMVTLAN